jgi:hypothetical protein
MIGTVHRCSGQSRIDNQSGYRVSLASNTVHSETPSDSEPNGAMIDAKMFFIFISVPLIFLLWRFATPAFPVQSGNFPTWFQGTMHMRIDVSVSFTLKCFIFSEPVAYSFSDSIWYRIVPYSETYQVSRFPNGHSP